MAEPRCAGGCGRTVSDPGKWCSACWPIDVSSKHVDQSDPRRPEPVKDSDQIRDEIREAAFRLRYGQDDERAEALETLSHLVTVLQHSQTNPNKET